MLNLPAPLPTTPLTALIVCLVLHGVIIKLFPRWQWLDFPHRYGLTRTPLPYPSGIVTWITFLAIFAWMQDAWTIQEIGLCAAIALLGITTLIDDRLSVSPIIRLLMQSLVALIIFGTGSRIYTLTNPLDAITNIPILSLDSIDLYLPLLGTIPVLSALFTVAWLLLTTNALNWFDGFPGHVHVLSIIGAMTLGFLSLSNRVDQPEVAMICFIVAAIALGALAFDLPIQRVVPGDSSAMFFGLMLGTISIYAGGKVATAFLVLGVPLIDSFIVILRRIISGKSPLKGSMTGEHLHHRLKERGWSNGQIMLLTAALGAGFGISALFLDTTEKFLAALLFGLIMLGLSVGKKKAD